MKSQSLVSDCWRKHKEGLKVVEYNYYADLVKKKKKFLILAKNILKLQQIFPQDVTADIKCYISIAIVKCFGLERKFLLHTKRLTETILND